MLLKFLQIFFIDDEDLIEKEDEQNFTIDLIKQENIIYISSSIQKDNKKNEISNGKVKTTPIESCIQK